MYRDVAAFSLFSSLKSCFDRLFGEVEEVPAKPLVLPIPAADGTLAAWLLF